MATLTIGSATARAAQRVTLPTPAGAHDRPPLATGLYVTGATTHAAGFALVLLGVLSGGARGPHLQRTGAAFMAAGLGEALLGYGIDRLGG